MIEIIEIIVAGAYALLICLGLVIVGAWCALVCLVDANNRIINLILALICFIIVSYAVGLRIV